MRPATAYFWLFPIFILVAASIAAIVFFLRYRKTVRHYFLAILSAGLYFSIYLLMVYETTLPRPMSGLSIMESGILMAVYSILTWDIPVSYSYALNRALPRKAIIFWMSAALVPLASAMILLLLPLSFDAKARILVASMDMDALLPIIALVATCVDALVKLGESDRGPRAARLAFAASAFVLLGLGIVGRYLLFPSAYPQGKLSISTSLVAWNLVATFISLAFGPGEGPEGAAVPVPDDFLKDSGITAREAEALELLAGGASYKEISAALGVSLPAVKKRISSVYRKSGAANRVELLNILIEYSRSPGSQGRH
jgi:DNA-binding CsgD family transcriptional regulator